MIQKIRLSWCPTTKILREVQLFNRERLYQAKAGWTCHRLLPTFGGFVVEKFERLAVTTDGKMFISIDDDGVNESLGQTFFWSIGKIHQAGDLCETWRGPKVRTFLGVPLQLKSSEIAVRRAVRIESFNLHSQRKIHLNKNGFDFI